MNYDRALNFIKTRREQDLIEAHREYMSRLGVDETLSEFDERYRRAVLEDVKSGTDEKGKKAKRELIAEIKRLGLYEKFYPDPHCDKCGDTGFVGGKICDCVKALSFNSDMVAFPLHDFSQIDYSLFGERDGAVFKKTASDMKIVFADKFPNTKKKIFSFLGSSGTGKTFLASCCVDAVLKKGLSAVFVTAFRFVSDMTKYHTTFSDERDSFIRPYLDCDLLAIDDLGTEAVYKNVTVEYLYLVINERQIAGKHTLITSNLSINRLAERYGERIASRILDKKTCYAAEFSGKDVRACEIGKNN